MSAVKTAYKDEMRKWYLHNIGEPFDKYHFIEVFKETYYHACKTTNAIEGFEEAGIVLWNPQKVKTKKLFLSAIYEKQESFPHIEADESRENIMPGTSGENEKQAEKEVSPVAVAEKEVSPQKQAEEIFSPEVAEEKPMVITVEKNKFKLVEFNEAVNEKT